MAQSNLSLHEAIWKNDKNAFSSCLQKGDDLNQVDENGLKPLHIAVMTCSEKFVKDLLSDKTKKVEIDSKTWYYLTATKNEQIVSHIMKYITGTLLRNLADENGFSPLHHAVINRNKRLVSSFCGLGCRVDARAKNGFTPLHFATVANDLQTIDMLLLRRADVSIKTVDGSTALHLAVRHRHADSACLLIAMGSSVNDIVDSSGSSALHIAVENNDESMVELLLQNNADVKCRDLAGINLLHLAAEHGHENWIEFFINKGIHVDSVTNNNSTSLLIALQNHKQNIVSMLLAHKANVNIKNNDGLSPLCVALQHNDTKLCKKLVTLKADINNSTLENSSVLHFAVKYCDKKMVAYLLQHGAKLGVRDHLGQNELHLAAKYNNSDVLVHLLKSGMNVNEKTLDKSTALHYAVSAKTLSYNNVEVLTKTGINIDAEDGKGDTALNIICRTTISGGDMYKIIEHLLIAKADPNHAGSDKNTPLYSLIENEHITTAMLLVKYGANCNRASSHGDSVLQLLIKFHCGCACTRTGYMKSFIELGADINSANDNGETVLHTSLMHEKHECLSEIKNLLDYGARLTDNQLGENVLHMALKHIDTYFIQHIFTFLLEKDISLYHFTENGSNILHYAVQYCDNANIIKVILDKTKHHLINNKDREGKTALHIAAASGASNLVEVLLERDVDINCKDKNNNSALNLAIIGKHIDTVQILLKKGASVTIKNKDGFTAYDLAEQKDRHIYQLLLNR